MTREPDLVLVPVDFSPGSEAAATCAARFAARLGWRLRLLHVLPPLHGASAGIAPTVRDDLIAAAHEARERAGRDLADLAARLAAGPGGAGAAAPETAVVTAADSTAETIVDAARESGAELIAMGTHGRSGFRRMILGSVAEHVIRAAECPVLTVKEAGRVP